MGRMRCNTSSRRSLPFRACLIFGAAFVILGTRLRYRDDAHKNFTAVGWILFGLVVLATAAGFWWFEQQFAALGYS